MPKIYRLYYSEGPGTTRYCCGEYGTPQEARESAIKFDSFNARFDLARRDTETNTQETPLVIFPAVEKRPGVPARVPDAYYRPGNKALSFSIQQPKPVHAPGCTYHRIGNPDPCTRGAR